jgi:peptide/nickel transport system ATP-binding protein/oligopeptide transport system ATP-binding protein
VDDVSFHLNKKEVVGLVGESGCGKSVTALSIMRLIQEPGRIIHGQIHFNETDLLQLPLSSMRDIRGNRISMIFQEPMTSLNPVYKIGHQISEVFFIHQKLSKTESWDRTVDMLGRVNIPSPERRADNYPHQLSGGMRQRVMIAMALACNPEILIADEPTTALDVTIQAQIMDLMMELQEELDTAILIITHDLGVIAQIAHRIVVMYAGKVVEEGQTLDVFEDPKHPYTQALLKSVPRIGGRSQSQRRHLHEITGVVPSLYELPRGCTFHPRCQEVMTICRETVPEFYSIDGDRNVRCLLYADS